MATMNFFLRPSSKSEVRECSVVIRFIHNRKVKDVTTGYKLCPEEWDNKSQSIIFSADSTRIKYLLDIEKKMSKDIHRFSDVISIFEQCREYSVSDITQLFRVKSDNTFVNFVKKLCKDLTLSKKGRAARAYMTASRNLLSFSGQKDMRLEHINIDLIQRYEQWLKDNRKSLNTISFNMRNLRAIYNKAIAEHLIPASPSNLFSGVYTGVCQANKITLSKEDIRALSELDPELYSNHAVKNNSNIKLSEQLRIALALFLFSFHARGMAYLDMAYLQKANIINDRIYYCRRKTKRHMEITINMQMRRILDFFTKIAPSTSPFIFPIIIPGIEEDRVQYERAMRKQNIILKELATLSGITKNISTNLAQHSWETIVKDQYFSTPAIRQVLGHNDKQSIYLDSFDNSIIDRISQKVSEIVT